MVKSEWLYNRLIANPWRQTDVTGVRDRNYSFSEVCRSGVELRANIWSTFGKYCLIHTGVSTFRGAICPTVVSRVFEWYKELLANLAILPKLVKGCRGLSTTSPPSARWPLKPPSRRQRAVSLSGRISPSPPPAACVVRHPLKPETRIN